MIDVLARLEGSFMVRIHSTTANCPECGARTTTIDEKAVTREIPRDAGDSEPYIYQADVP